MKLEFKEREGQEETEEAEEASSEKGRAHEYTRLGDLLRDRGAFQAASVEYKKALDYEPYNAKILNKLGLSRVLAGNYKEALVPLERLTQVYPGYSNGFVNLGLAYSGLKDDDRAAIAFARAVELNPFNPLPYQRLAELYRKRGDSADAKIMEESLAIINKKPGG
jgi:Tfp pilus assembly protein PilF